MATIMAAVNRVAIVAVMNRAAIGDTPRCDHGARWGEVTIGWALSYWKGCNSPLYLSGDETNIDGSQKQESY